MEEEKKTEGNFKFEVKKEKGLLRRFSIWHISTMVLGLLLITSIFTGGFYMEDITGATTSGDLDVIILNDKRCAECDVTGLITQLKLLFPNMKVEEIDYSTNKGKKLYEDNDLSLLPAVLFTSEVKQDAGYANVANYFEEKGKYLSLKIGAAFDPNGEICDNSKDDNMDGKIDCEDDNCKNAWKCMEKKDVPDIELFVMGYCPFGTQVEKGMLPVIELLGKKVNFNVKFCDYAMHGLQEIEEQKRQYCIQKEQNSKFLGYLRCFLEDGKSADCLKKVGVDETKLNICVINADKEFKITQNYNDKSTWIGSYPSFGINKADNVKYGVRGSPTLIINGVMAETGRDSASLLKAVCTGFKNQPSECSRTLSSETPSSGFGYDTASTTETAAAGCGV